MHVNKNGSNKIRQICLSNLLLFSEFSDKISISCRPVSFRIPIIFSTHFKSKHANIQPCQRRNVHFGLGTLSGKLTLKSLGKCTLEAMFFQWARKAENAGNFGFHFSKIRREKVSFLELAGETLKARWRTRKILYLHSQPHIKIKTPYAQIWIIYSLFSAPRRDCFSSTFLTLYFR